MVIADAGRFMGRIGEWYFDTSTGSEHYHVVVMTGRQG
jgi:hypothetical protein